MLQSVTILSIERRPDRTFIRTSQGEIEILGDEASLRQWIAENVARVDPDAMVALQLADHIKADPLLKATRDISQKSVEFVLVSAANMERADLERIGGIVDSKLGRAPRTPAVSDPEVRHG